MEPQRLGKGDLGPHAFERRMPDRIARLLSAHDGDKNVIAAMTHLHRLLMADATRYDDIYLCSLEVPQIWRLAREGNHFCAYRCLQMILAALNGLHSTKDTSAHAEANDHGKPPPGPATSTRHTTFSYPSISQIQADIETAWASGINAAGKTFTGGVAGTRKHIGTPEAEAVLLHLGFKCIGLRFQGSSAAKDLIDRIETYFTAQSPALDPTSANLATTSPLAPNVSYVTSRPPIFLQRPKHSFVVVGLTRTNGGKRRLLAFDPAWPAPLGIVKKDRRWYSRLRVRRLLRSYYVSPNTTFLDDPAFVRPIMIISTNLRASNFSSLNLLVLRSENPSSLPSIIRRRPGAIRFISAVKIQQSHYVGSGGPDSLQVTHSIALHGMDSAAHYTANMIVPGIEVCRSLDCVL